LIRLARWTNRRGEPQDTPVDRERTSTSAAVEPEVLAFRALDTTACVLSIHEPWCYFCLCRPRQELKLKLTGDRTYLNVARLSANTQAPRFSDAPPVAARVLLSVSVGGLRERQRAAKKIALTRARARAEDHRVRHSCPNPPQDAPRYPRAASVKRRYSSTIPRRSSASRIR
jgi:hypothetical protein